VWTKPEDTLPVTVDTGVGVVGGVVLAGAVVLGAAELGDGVDVGVTEACADREGAIAAACELELVPVFPHATTAPAVEPAISTHPRLKATTAIGLRERAGGGSGTGSGNG
jgi:hypothetical protein